MHGDVDLVREQRAIDLLREERAPIDGPQRHVRAHVAFGLDVHQLDMRRAGLRTNELCHAIGLPKRQRRSARADAKVRAAIRAHLPRGTDSPRPTR